MAMNVVINMLINHNNAMRINDGARRKRRSSGFTMAEMLIVVAIIGVLAAVSFIAVQAHQKSMTQLQYDAIAKEIFVAAQNHLTLAKSENYGQVSDLNTNTALNLKVGDKYFFGPDGNATADTVDDIRYFISSTDNSSTALDQIIPFGAVELVTGGNYIIRYQPNAARVLDVFYWTDDKKYGIGSIDYTTAVNNYAGEGKKDDRKKIGGNGVLGWCGGEGIVNSGEYLEAPEIEVINAEMLLVNVTDKNTSDSKKALTPQLKLIVEGDISGAKIAILLDSTKATYIKNGDRVEYKDSGKFTIVLDDITTSGLHFSELLNKKTDGTLDNGKSFVPGENITIQAVAYSNTVLASIAYSGEWTTNSLFGKVTEDTSGTKPVADKVHISNIRHLENLNDSLSSVAYNDAYYDSSISAVQTVDLDWAAFKTEINKWKGTDAGTSISIFDKTGETKSGCFLPVTVSDTYKLTYDGQYEVEIAQVAEDGAPAAPKKIKENHSIKGIVVDNTGDTPGTASFASGGVFGSLNEASIKNLALIDTSVTLASGDAGALVGKLVQNASLGEGIYNISNVVAYHTDGKADTAKITAASGNAGGLIGQTVGEHFKIEKSAAALIVNSTGGDAGGLIGKAEGGTVIGCYAGGHTIDSPTTNAVIYKPGEYNVTASGNAGGLIGDATATEIKYSYSTCSATGATVGGLIGNATGSIQYSYCTGLVKSTAATPVEGAFAGTWTYTGQATTDGNSYFEIINERKETYTNASGAAVETGGYIYLDPVSGSETVTGITAMDATASTFNKFSNPGTTGYTWQSAIPYNDTLTKYYGEGSGTSREAKYILKTVAQLALLDSLNTEFAVQGEPGESDNPQIPADFVIQHYGDWPAPEIFVVNTQTN